MLFDPILPPTYRTSKQSDPWSLEIEEREYAYLYKYN